MNTISFCKKTAGGKPMEQMKVWFAASEAAPFAKTGGLADVAGSLPKALKKLGIDIRVVMPKYRQIPQDMPTKWNFWDTLMWIWPGAMNIAGYLHWNMRESLSTFWIMNAFSTGIGITDRWMTESGLRFSVRLSWKSFLFIDFKTYLIHCNDWQTGLVSALSMPTTGIIAIKAFTSSCIPS